MIYQASLYLIKILSSSSFSESFFANDWAFLFDCSSFIIFRSMIKVNELIRMSSDIFVSSVHTCRMTDSSDYSWSSLLTIMSCFQSSSWLSSSWTRTFILIWASTLTSSSMKALANVCRSIESRIYSNKWTRHWSSLVKLWSKHRNKWWIKLISIERRSITRLNQRCFWMNETSLQRDFSKKLNDKMLDSFQITESVDSFYKLKLSETMRIHDVFHSELLRSAVDDSLSDQKNEFSKSIVINDEDKWEIDNILNSWCYKRQLQYRVKWKSYDNDLNWYNADNNEFMNAQEMIDDFHIKYSRKAH